MGRCSCSGSASCACVVQAGDGIVVRGSGSSINPYVIENTATVERYINTLDTPSVDLTLEGGGTPGNPFILSAEATLRLVDLSDVNDLQGPQGGDVPMWIVDHWEFVQPPGGTGGGTAVSGPGLVGDGSGANPLKAAVSGVWGSGSMTGFPTDKTLGLPVYVDGANQLRARPTPVVRYAVNPLGSFATNWAQGGNASFWYQFGPIVFFRASIQRSGPSISVPSGASADIANGPICQLSADLPVPLQGSWPVHVTDTGAGLGLFLNADRSINLAYAPPNYTIGTGVGYSISGFYFANTGVVL